MARMHPTSPYELLRLGPGDDLRESLAREARRPGRPPLAVAMGMGSLRGARLRPAAEDAPLLLEGPLELLTLSGTLTRDGVHLHASVADGAGRVRGGHLLAGAPVRTTAELVLLPLEGWRASRRTDPRTGYRELQVRRAPARR
jgi:predicted DNA-binding protein with PD1-like motif